MADDYLRQADWDNFDMAGVTKEELDGYTKPIREFFLTHTTAKLYEEAIKRNFILFPVSTVKDFFESPQLAARDFWIDVKHPELGASITYPGAFAKLSETPCQIRRRAPLIGEHNEEIYHKELGISSQELILLKESEII